MPGGQGMERDLGTSGQEGGSARDRVNPFAALFDTGLPSKTRVQHMVRVPPGLGNRPVWDRGTRIWERLLQWGVEGSR